MKKLLSVFVTLFVLACPVILASCSNSSIGNPLARKSADASSSTADTDGDGLDDGLELLYGTSAVLADTDGDGMSDAQEIQQLGFDPAIDPIRFNPLVADIPQLAIVLKSPPIVTLQLTDSVGVSKSFSVTKDQEYAVTIDQAFTDSTVDTIEVSQTASNATEFVNGAPVDTTISYDINKTITQDVSFSYSKTQTVENVVAITEAEAFSETREIVASGGILKVVVGFANVGNVPFIIQHVILSAVIPDPLHPGVFFPVGDLILDTGFNYTQFEPVTLAPGQSFPIINYINATLDLETAKLLLRNPGELIITVATLELSDLNGVPLPFNFTDIMARDALFVIDYAGKRLPEKYFVATNSNPLNPGVTAGHTLRDILRIPFETNSASGNQTGSLTGLRNDPNVRASGPNAFWLVVQTRNNGLGNVVTTYDPRAGDFDFENILLKAGDVLFLVWMEDKDGDGIFSRQERLLGTSDLNADSDGDGWSDFYELHVSLTDPTKADTDGDGVIDSKDAYPLDRARW
jgi:thrombospondin type 3 repeat protein